MSICALLYCPLQFPLVLHAQNALPCWAKHSACRKPGGRAIACTSQPSYVGLRIDKANLKKVAAVCSKLGPDLLYTGVQALNRMSTCIATSRAPRASAMEAETMLVRTSGAWPLLAT